MAFSLFNPKDPVERYRGKVMQQRFEAPPGQKAGPFSSWIGGFIEYAGVVEKAGKEPIGGFDAWFEGEIDRFITPSPSPTPVSIDINAADKQKARRSKRRDLGRMGTILTGGLGGKGTLLGGTA